MSNMIYARFRDVEGGSVRYGEWLPLEFVYGVRVGDALAHKSDKWLLERKEFSLDTNNHDGTVEINVDFYVREA